jgi:hypothetical protein
MLNINTFYALGRSGIPFKAEIIKKIFIAFSILISFRYGIKVLIVGQVISSYIVFLIATFTIKRIINVSLSRQLVELYPAFLIVVACALFDWLIIDRYFFDSYRLLLLSKMIILPLIYIGLSLLYNRKVLNEFVMIFDNIIPRRIRMLINK